MLKRLLDIDMSQINWVGGAVAIIIVTLIFGFIGVSGYYIGVITTANNSIEVLSDCTDRLKQCNQCYEYIDTVIHKGRPRPFK